MNCLVIAATPVEIAPFLSEFRGRGMAHQGIDVLITGIGLTTTTYSLTRQLRIKKPDLIIQAGVAGCFDRKISLGTVVAVQRDIMADESVIESQKLKTKFDLKLAFPNKFPYSKGWLVNKSGELKKLKLRKVKGISVNQITASVSIFGLYKQKFNPAVESMEGAALHYVCLMEQIPFIQLRSVSNYITERNKRKWKMKDAITNLNHELNSLVNQLSD